MKRMERLTRLGILAGLLFCMGVVNSGASDTSYVGTATCTECHDEMAIAFDESFHGLAWASSGKNDVSGCESCHGPGSKHADDPSKESIISFGKESVQTAEQRADACLGCHISSKELDFWGTGKHASNNVDCSSCHSIHASSVPKVSQPDVCFDCHKEVRRQANKPSHHPIIEGKVSCNDCHNPHGSLEHGMVRADSYNQLCYRCHAEKRGPFVYEHPPVEENCGTCHEPHGSRHDMLLTQRGPNICQECHGISDGHPDNAFDGTTGFEGTNSTSNKRRFVARHCLNCHNMIHGSNGNRRFVREEI